MTLHRVYTMPQPNEPPEQPLIAVFATTIENPFLQSTRPAKEKQGNETDLIAVFMLGAG